MKIYISLFIVLLAGRCSNKDFKAVQQEYKNNAKTFRNSNIEKYAQTITSNELKTHLYKYASDEFEGRETGTEGQKKAVNFLADYYKSQGIVSPQKDSSYFQTIPSSYLGKKYNASENVVAFIKGDENPEEVVIISAHLDHIGIDKNNAIFNGADDDGSGTVAIMEMAQAFKKAQNDGVKFKRSILFLHVTAEEIGLYGSRYYTENPIFSIDKTIANLNIDMIGRVDNKHTDNINYIYLIGSNRLSSELHYLSESTNSIYTNLELDYTFNAKNDPNRYYYRSDHYNFAKKGIPVIFYFNGEHEDYHKASDTPDKINYPLLEKRTKLIFATAWELANRAERITVDKSK